MKTGTIGRSIDVTPTYDGLKIKCPNCNREKLLAFFVRSKCECGVKLRFNVEVVEEEEE